MDLQTPLPLCDGRYRLVALLGQGGMATVYRAFDTRLQVERAIKIIDPNLATSAKLRARFEEEAQTMARLQHPQIVAVQDVGTDGERAFIVMELLAGGSLMSQVEASGPLPIGLAIETMCKVLAGLAHAHQHGVVHRDMKPHNVLICPHAGPKVGDFGIARLQGRERAVTMTGARLGTMEYMAPEINADATKATVQSDLYAVAGTMFAVLRGRAPPALYADNLHARIFKGVPSPLSDVIIRAGRYDPGERYPSAEAMIAALREADATIRRQGSSDLLGVVPPDDPTNEDPGNRTVFPSIAGNSLAGPTALVPTDGRSSPSRLPAPPRSIEEAELREIADDVAANTRRGRMVMGIAGIVVLALVALGLSIPSEAPPPPAAPPTPVRTAEVLVEEVPAEEPVAGEVPGPVDVELQIQIPPPPRPPPVPAALGKLFANTEPLGSVRVDGQPPQSAPLLNVDLSVGTHRLTFSAPDQPEGALSVTIREGEATKVCWDFVTQAECRR